MFTCKKKIIFTISHFIQFLLSKANQHFSTLNFVTHDTQWCHLLKAYGAYGASHRVRGGVHPGQITPPSGERTLRSSVAVLASLRTSVDFIYFFALIS